jgi:uncharacterized protein YqcC (DUF446 family)
MMNIYEEASQKIDAIEGELKRLGRWEQTAPPPEAFEHMGAFGSHTMAFEQWLEFVLIPRVRAIITAQGSFPSSSQVSVYAIREWDGVPDVDRLLTLLREFDDLFERS